jgi:hypothetical protein
MLFHYYDICSAENFDALFGDLYIGKNPTPKCNSYFVLRFDFSGLDINSLEKFEMSFKDSIRNSVIIFLDEHKFQIENYEETLKELERFNSVYTYIDYVFRIISSSGKKAFIIIDEYDPLVNGLIALGTNMNNNQYNEIIGISRVVRNFYEILKYGTQTVVDRMFITGIMPLILDGVTSGFNISNNISNDIRYNEILGFTEEEVEFLINEGGIDREQIAIDRKFFYNGYLFHENAKNKLYHPAMITYFLRQVQDGKINDFVINEKLKTDYDSIKNLLKKTENIRNLDILFEAGTIPAQISTRFSIDEIYETKNFLSLLYYMGLVTIDNSTPLAALKIPNYSSKTMYWEFINRILTKKHKGLSLDDSQYLKPIYQLAYENNYEPFFEYFSKYIVHYLSNRDLQNTVEKDIKFLMLPIFFTSNYYFPISELENSEGYTDIYLKRSHLHPKSISEWIFEIKYIKQADAKNEKLIKAEKTKAIQQLQRYKTSNLFKDRTDVRYLAVVFAGKKEYTIVEI